MKTTTTVDDGLDQKEAGWEFDDDVAAEFDSHVRKSIPHYAEVQSLAAKLSDWFLKGDSDTTEYIYDLGCATGETIATFVDHHDGTANIKYVGIDEQPAMLQQADEKIPSTTDYRLVNDDITTSPSFPDATLVLSLFTLSFLPEGDRQRVLAAIYRDLAPGGAFICCEKTRARSPFFDAIWTEHYWDFKSAQGLSDDQILGKARSLRGQLRPLSVADYHTLFTAAGFDTDANVDIFYKWHQWTGFVARKPPTAAAETNAE